MDHTAVLTRADTRPVASPDRWTTTVRVVVAPVLPDLRAEDLPTDHVGLIRFGAALEPVTAAHADPTAIGASASDPALGHAHAVIGAAALHAGWSVVPGSPPRFRRGGRTADLFAAYTAVLDGRLPAGSWAATCRRAGLVAAASAAVDTNADLANHPVASQPFGCTLGPPARPAPARSLTYRARLREVGLVGAEGTLVIHGDVVSWGTDWVRAGDVVTVAYGRRTGARPAVHVALATPTTRLRLDLRRHGRHEQASLEAYAALRRWSAGLVEPMLVAGHLETVATFDRAEVAGVLVDAEGLVLGGGHRRWADIAAVSLDDDGVVVTAPDRATGAPVVVARVPCTRPDAVLLPALCAQLMAPGSDRAARGSDGPDDARATVVLDRPLDTGRMARPRR